MSETAYLHIDWRATPSKSERRQLIYKLLTALDVNRTAKVRSSTVGQKLASLVSEEGRPPMILKKDEQRERSWRSSAAYWARMYSVARAVTDLLDQDQQVMARFFEYKQIGAGSKLTARQIRNAYHDLALSIGVHPWALGVLPEARGQVTLPKSLTIHYKLVNNIMLWQKGFTQDSVLENKRFNDGVSSPIPALIESIEVKLPTRGKKSKKVNKPVAVVVVEHRNLKQVVTADADGVNLIIVMTAGYPGFATREFLHLLSCSPVLQEAPFLYFSDHDFQGAEIFQCLKYGAARSAESSESMICPQLKWTGPSKADLLASVDGYEQAWKQQYESDHPHASASEEETAFKKWADEKNLVLHSKLASCSNKDRQMMHGFTRLGWLTHESILKQELLDMLSQKAKFRLSDLVQVNNSYISMFVAAKVNARLSREQVTSMPPVARGSPTAERWKQMASQVAGAAPPDMPAIAEEPAEESLTRLQIALANFN